MVERVELLNNDELVKLVRLLVEFEGVNAFVLRWETLVRLWGVWLDEL